MKNPICSFDKSESQPRNDKSRLDE